jgi:spore coat polysaccharide biosynthesis protein SpsF (cytidylyltransferase family)
MTVDVKAFVQARMSSSRFPGKVLAPFRGEPLVLHVVRAVGAALGEGAVVVATSDEPSDDPLAAYLGSIGVPCFRGPRDNVLERFRLCAQSYPSGWLLRVCADSPLLDPDAVRVVVAAASDDVDVVSTVLGSDGRAAGTNVELVRTSVLLGVDLADTTESDREHVMPYFYRHPDRYRLLAVAEPAEGAGTVDTVEDLVRLESS